MTPLHWACQNGHEDCVQVLLQYGADRTVMNKFDKTPEAIAFDIDRLDIIQTLQVRCSTLMLPDVSCVFCKKFF